ncbi:MAG TPA: tetratricopeptide repeat protein, partial [Wenzhouxiangellaceae bacterium]|nr:tetratricopeptide repeat protein [Wenzhouxiangellaceae bacterium]
ATRMLAEEPEHPALYAESLRNLAITRANKREFDRAESLFNQSLDIYADLPVHVSERYWVINDLAAFYMFTGQTEKARPLFEELVEYRVDTLGEAHPETLHAEGNLAAAAMALDRLDQAQPIYQRLEDRYLDLYGPDSPQLGQVRYRLGRIALEQGELDRSSELLAEARRTQLLNRGPDDANLATIISWQAAVAERQGNLDLAVAHLRDSLGIYDRIRPDPHPSKLELRISIGETLDRLQRREESLAAYAQAVRSLDQFGDQFGLRTAEGLLELARHSLEANEIARANQALEQAAQAAASAEQSDSSDRLIRQINQMMASIE